ncbi:MAG: hypothetical protein QNK04_11980 [Myxococcota bacterium]|nr:hypothetical protein [Myxococcota bacterium]
MAPAGADGASSVIVVSRDHGELGFALSFLREQALARHATLALPENLYFANREAMPAPVFPYSTLDDIGKIVEGRKAERIFLFSGYLLPNEGMVTPERVEGFVRGLQRSGRRIVTSDPFLGMASGISASQIDPRKLVRSLEREHAPWLRWLFRRLLRRGLQEKPVLSVARMDGVDHLYATSIPEAPGASGGDARRLVFFNPAMTREAAGPGASTRPRWLFVLSSTDLECQRMTTGLVELAGRVEQRLRDALDAGRRPTLIAPPWMIETLAAKLPEEVELLAFCSFPEFETRLLAAEYVFYWNAISFSLLPRIARGLPVFAFDRGHLAQLADWALEGQPIKPFYRNALACHFGGWEPPLLDPTATLDASRLATLAEQQRPRLREILARWLTSPTPDEVVAALRGDPID